MKPILFVLPNKNYYLRMREIEREIKKKGTGEIPYTNLCCIFLLCFMLLSLSVPLFFVLSMSFAVCVFALFFYICFSFLPSVLSFLFFSACLSLFIERFQRNCSLLFSQLIRSWSNFCQFFPPQLLISCSVVTHFSAFFSFLCSVTF